jgi:hypothetical protein
MENLEASFFVTSTSVVHKAWVGVVDPRPLFTQLMERRWTSRQILDLSIN